MIYIELFLTFFKIGLFAVGGGLATLPFLKELTYTTDWITMADISNMVAVSESTPGPLGVNMATYVGFLKGNVLGAIIAPLGLVLPSVIIILIVSKFLTKFKNSKAVEHTFSGLRPASVALVASAGVSLIKVAFFNGGAFFWQGAVLGVLVYLGLLKFNKIHPVVFILLSAVVGIIFKF